MSTENLLFLFFCIITGGLFFFAISIYVQVVSSSNKILQLQEQVSKRLADQQLQNDNRDASLKENLLDQLHRFRSYVSDKLHLELSNHSSEISEKLNTQLDAISCNVEQRLASGFDKTTATFLDIAQRLILIDDAQKKLMELSKNVINLKEILVDKRSRGAFGEVQLNYLIANILPSKNFSFQHQLSNGLRCDCLLFLPEPTCNVVIDSKFPLENYQGFTSFGKSENERQKFKQQFRQNIKKHISDIAEKYIIPNETADGAIMFIPAEAIFSEIHSNFPDLVEFSHNQRVWLASPTTMMAILTTASAVLKDTATREHVHLIQEHLGYLAKDFERFEGRMQKLARHIEQAQDDVKQVHTSAKKITQRFQKIEQVELHDTSSKGRTAAVT